MRAVIQRVTAASVEVGGDVVSKIGPGLLVLVGIKDGDTDADADYICRKILGARLFENTDSGKAWDKSVVDKGYEIILVSQFTLYGFFKGNKPDFHHAMPPGQAKDFYDSFVKRVRDSYKGGTVEDGVFGAKMTVNITNDGPVTLNIDSEVQKPS
mmetsp:Transcript_22326/g.26860  ORF Transcript_22326/g.26860 Transcript_22326/m.26860 type:complete len:155 (-) Transcript_22326:195-659(-)|eukprot:CAMPEP_0197854438 /NCGR_PEP_ID=MMETSP1438-20131217/24680_1 /TAXON_ID=1461541 /ORGANISM="Pterosperma sp., Strain CCMP1384" /LENGTH=154 /DNA_ID=CAMNT_0043469177 /DNA_START=204 /DNA_END=668 /DNA_ORIENTATION=+